VSQSFARQRALQTIGARLQSVLPGVVEIRLDFRPELGACQQSICEMRSCRCCSALP